MKKKHETNPRLGRVGGEAVLEGVMMRCGDRYSIASRHEDGSISVENRNYVSLRKRNRFWNLPLVRGVVVGLNQIPRDVLESARAMGMSGAQRFLHVQLPLALPVFLRSLRVVMVQTVGMAVIAALIGAGGFGALVFQGLLSSAIDLVLLGVIPVIVLAVLTDALFDLLIALLKVKRND